MGTFIQDTACRGNTRPSHARGIVYLAWLAWLGVESCRVRACLKGRPAIDSGSAALKAGTERDW